MIYRLTAFLLGRFFCGRVKDCIWKCPRGLISNEKRFISNKYLNILSAAFCFCIVAVEPTLAISGEASKPLSSVIRDIPALDSKDAIQGRIEALATFYGVEADVMKYVVACESSYRPKVRGDGGKARGLVQIHSDYHPEVTDEMAFDPEFALNFLAKKLKEGRGHLWTCYRQMPQVL